MPYPNEETLNPIDETKPENEEIEIGAPTRYEFSLLPIGQTITYAGGSETLDVTPEFAQELIRKHKAMCEIGHRTPVTIDHYMTGEKGQTTNTVGYIDDVYEKDGWICATISVKDPDWQFKLQTRTIDKGSVGLDLASPVVFGNGVQVDPPYIDHFALTATPLITWQKPLRFVASIFEKITGKENKPKPVEVTMTGENTAQNAAFEAALKDKANLEAALKEAKESAAKAELALQERIKTERKGKMEASLKALVEEGKLAAEDATGLADLLTEADPALAEKMLATLTNAPSFKPAEPAKPLEKASEALTDKDYADFWESEKGKAFKASIGKKTPEQIKAKYPKELEAEVKIFKGIE